MQIATLDQCQKEYDAMSPDEPDECQWCGCYIDDEHEENCPAYEPEDHSYCPDCKTVDGCSCDEQYQSFRDNQLGL